jgi:hypothetical protein
MAEQLANNADGTLNGAINSAVTSLTLQTGEGAAFPSTGNFRIVIDAEIILVGARSGDTLSSLTRGVEGTAAAAHANGAAVAHVLTKGGMDAYLASRELAYAEITVSKSITAIPLASADVVVTAPALTFDGATTVMIEFCAPYMRGGTTYLNLRLWDGATDLGQIGFVDPTNKYATAAMKRRITPSAGSHTFSIRAVVDAGTGSVGADTGTGSATPQPAFIRIERVA